MSTNEILTTEPLAAQPVGPEPVADPPSDAPRPVLIVIGLAAIAALAAELYVGVVSSTLPTGPSQAMASAPAQLEAPTPTTPLSASPPTL